MTTSYGLYFSHHSHSDLDQSDLGDETISQVMEIGQVKEAKMSPGIEGSSLY